MSERSNNAMEDMSDRKIAEEQLDELRLMRTKLTSINGILMFYLILTLAGAVYWGVLLANL